MTGGIGDEKLSGRSGISFDIINESENFPILEIFFVDRFGLYRMRIGQMMTVFEIMIQGGIVVDLFIGEMEFGVADKKDSSTLVLPAYRDRLPRWPVPIARNNRVECREKRPTVFQESRS